MKAVASRLGHTSTRMMDTVYVELYSEVSWPSRRSPSAE
jgi:hypothetical protein